MDLESKTMTIFDIKVMIKLGDIIHQIKLEDMSEGKRKTRSKDMT